jgi:phenylacetic acid degradation operon negative regulatory protein
VAGALDRVPGLRRLGAFGHRVRRRSPAAKVPHLPATLPPELLERIAGLDRRERPIRAWSWIVTVYGDVVAPRGGELALGSLLAICAALGIASGVVRTALTRLVADGLIERRRVGRNSFHRLAPRMADEFARATERIYFAAPQRWSGAWRLAVLPAGGEEPAREALRRAGYGDLAPGVLIAPLGLDGGPCSGREPDPGQAVLLDATGTTAAGRTLAARAWRLDLLARSYRDFLDTFAPLAAALATGAEVGELEALVIRIRLVHAYRRIALKDPLLPDELLPPGWPGHEARRTCAAIYRRVRGPAERWLDRHALAAQGPLPPPDQSLYRRFAAV